MAIRPHPQVITNDVCNKLKIRERLKKKNVMKPQAYMMGLPFFKKTKIKQTKDNKHNIFCCITKTATKNPKTNIQDQITFLLRNVKT